MLSHERLSVKTDKRSVFYKRRKGYCAEYEKRRVCDKKNVRYAVKKSYEEKNEKQNRKKISSPFWK